MSILLGLVLPVVLVTISIWMGTRELRVYRESPDFGSDLFVYSKGRLWRRLAGCVLLALTGLTLSAIELFPARSVSGVSIYLMLLCAEVVALIVLPLVDLWETARTARPGDPTRADPDRQTRKR